MSATPRERPRPKRPLASDRIEAAAASWADQRPSLAPIDLAESLRQRSKPEASAVQAEVNRQLGERGLGPLVGHKIGCTTPVMQTSLGIPNPCAGDIFGSTIVENGASVSRPLIAGSASSAKSSSASRVN